MIGLDGGERAIGTGEGDRAGGDEQKNREHDGGEAEAGSYLYEAARAAEEPTEPASEGGPSAANAHAACRARAGGARSHWLVGGALC